jgi:hypothetical protein
MLAKFGSDPQRKPDLMEHLLREASAVLRMLGDHFCEGYSAEESG